MSRPSDYIFIKPVLTLPLNKIRKKRPGIRANNAARTNGFKAGKKLLDQATAREEGMAF